MLAYPTQLRVLNFPTFPAHQLPSRFVQITRIPRLQKLQITEIASSAWPMFATILRFPDEIATHRRANWHYHSLLRSNYIPVLADVARCSSVSSTFRFSSNLAVLFPNLTRIPLWTEILHLRFGSFLFDFQTEFQRCRANSPIVCPLTSSKTRYSIDYRVSKRKNHGLLLPSHLIDANSSLGSFYCVRRCTDNVNWQFSVFEQNYRFIVFLIVDRYFIVSRVICSIWNPSIGKLIS